MRRDRAHLAEPSAPDSSPQLRVYPHAYMKDVLSRLPTQRASQVGELLPHRWQPTLTIA